MILVTYISNQKKPCSQIQSKYECLKQMLPNATLSNSNFKTKWGSDEMFATYKTTHQVIFWVCAFSRVYNTAHEFHCHMQPQGARNPF